MSGPPGSWTPSTYAKRRPSAEGQSTSARICSSSRHNPAIGREPLLSASIAAAASTSSRRTSRRACRFVAAAPGRSDGGHVHSSGPSPVATERGRGSIMPAGCALFRPRMTATPLAGRDESAQILRRATMPAAHYLTAESRQVPSARRRCRRPAAGSGGGGGVREGGGPAFGRSAGRGGGAAAGRPRRRARRAPARATTRSSRARAGPNAMPPTPAALLGAMSRDDRAHPPNTASADPGGRAPSIAVSADQADRRARRRWRATRRAAGCRCRRGRWRPRASRSRPTATKGVAVRRSACGSTAPTPRKTRPMTARPCRGGVGGVVVGREATTTATTSRRISLWKGTTPALLSPTSNAAQLANTSSAPARKMAAALGPREEVQHRVRRGGSAGTPRGVHPCRGRRCRRRRKTRAGARPAPAR